MAYLGDPTWWFQQTEIYKISEADGFVADLQPFSWWEQQKQMENRPSWGHYWPDEHPDNYLSIYDRPIYCWQSMCLPYRTTPMEDVMAITKWLIENIDNVWEGPIGYLGVWKFRFTEESDAMIFKLII